MAADSLTGLDVTQLYHQARMDVIVDGGPIKHEVIAYHLKTTPPNLTNCLKENRLPTHLLRLTLDGDCQRFLIAFIKRVALARAMDPDLLIQVELMKHAFGRAIDSLQRKAPVKAALHEQQKEQVG